MLDHLEFVQTQIEKHLDGKLKIADGFSATASYRECFRSVYSHFVCSGEMLPIESLELPEKERIFNVALSWWHGSCEDFMRRNILTSISKGIYLIENLSGVKQT